MSTPPPALATLRAVRWRRWAVIALATLATLCLVLWLAVPYAARWAVESAGTRALGRPMHLAEASFNPFILTATLKDLQIEGRGGEPALLRIEQMRIGVSPMTVLRLAPVITALRIDGLEANIARLGENQFNFSDIVGHLQEQAKSKPKKASDEPALFAVYNIELARGRVLFDDRVVGRKHDLSEIAIGVPFISSLPVDNDINVEPGFSARINGSPLKLDGATKPFSESQETAVQLKLDGLDLPTFLGYSPVKLNFTLPSGKLDTDLRIAFHRAVAAREKQAARDAEIVVSGALGVRDFALHAPTAQPQPLLRWQALAVDIGAFAPLTQRIDVTGVRLTAPEVWATRDAQGSLNWQRFATAPVGTAAAASADAPKTTAPSAPPRPGGASTSRPGATPLALDVRKVDVNGGIVHVRDDSLGAFTIDLTDLAASAEGLSTAASEPGKFQLSARAAPIEALKANGEVRLQPLAGTLAFDVQGVDLRGVARIVDLFANATLTGSVTSSGKLAFARDGETLTLKAEELAATATKVALRGPRGNTLDIDEARVENGKLDLHARRVEIGRVGITAPRLAGQRDPDRAIGWTQIVKAARRAQADEARPAAEASGTPWTVRLNEVDLQRGSVDVEDRSVRPSYRLIAQQLALNVKNVVADGSEPAQLTLRSRVGKTGTLGVDGEVRWDQPRARLAVDARNLDIANVRSYFAHLLNAQLASAEFSTRGRVDASLPKGAAPQIAYSGNARLANLHALNPDGASDLLRWQALDIDKVDLRLDDAPLRVELGQVKLADFFARVAMSEEGRLNLADLVKREPVAGGEKSSKPAAAPEAAPGAARPTIRIGGIAFERGNVNFTDNFIKPNYTTNLTQLGGSVSALASDSPEAADLQLAGKIDDESPVEIKGSLNPLAPKLQLDIAASTRGVDMPRFTPYTARYAGYPITKGKLSMDVHYKVVDQKLTATNHLFLDQLTLGEKTDSPDATKLPVPLAVSLLKNTRGEIDLHLPISGSLDDPKFSLGSIILQVIGNLIAKAITAPFALLASASGGGEELGYVEFAPGQAQLVPEQAKRLETLSKALNDRPAVRVDIIGRVDPAADAEGVSRAKYEAKLRAAKVRSIVRSGGQSVDPAKIAIEPAERPALIETVYDDEKIPDKPRNVIGIAKSIPAPEMEQLILKHLQATPDDLRALANERAAAVRNQLETQGKVPRERLFLVEPKLAADGIKDQGAKTRVDFVLK